MLKSNAMTHSLISLLFTRRSIKNFVKSNRKYIFFLVALFFLSNQSFSQSVTTISIDLRGKKDTSVTISSTSRNGNICSGSNCIKFNIILDSRSDLLSLDVQNPAPPGAAAFYQVNCGPATSLATPVCISGLSTVSITYCKPGNDKPNYIISATSIVRGSADLNLRTGCSGLMTVTGLQKSSIIWTSVATATAIQGAYNNYLSCSTGCDSTRVIPTAGAPAFIDYMVSGSANNCSTTSRDTIRVFTYPALTVSIAPVSPTICSGASTTLTATAVGGSGPYTYTWSSGQTTSSITTGAVGAYTVTVRDTISGCPAVSQPVTVTAATTPAAPTAIGTTICSGSAATLTATAPGGTYQWFAAAGGTALATSPTYTTPFLTTTTTYYVETTVGACFSARTAVTVSVTNLPAAPTAAGTAICSGNTASLISTAPGGTYQWFAAASGGALLESNATYTTPVLNANTTYYVQATVNNCTSNARTPVVVMVNPTPVAPTAAGTTICSGNTASLIATAPAGTYRWYDAAVAGNLLITNATYTTPVLSVNTTYYVDATSVAGCTGPRTAVIVNVTPITNPAFKYSTGTFCVTGTNPIPVIAGAATGTFSASPAGLVFVSASTGQINLIASALNTYTITFITNGNCVYSSSANVAITNSPNATFVYSGPYCQKLTNPLPTLARGASAGVFTADLGGLVFQNTSTGEIDLSNSAAGNYILTNTITAAGGCATVSATNSITINPMATVNTGRNQTVCAAIPVVLAGSIGGAATSATWSGGRGSFSNATMLTTVYTPAANESNVKLYLTSNDPAGPCGSAIDSMFITILPIPVAPTVAPDTICAGNTTSLTATAPGGTYQWYDAASAGIPLATGATYTTPVLSNSIIYYVQTTLNNCIGPRTAVTVSVTPLPSAPTAAAAPICSGNTADLIATAPGGSYQWYDAPSAGNLLAINTTYTTPVLNNSITFYVQTTLNNCTSSSRTPVTIIVNPTPVAPTATGAVICKGTTASLTATAPGGIYRWYDTPASGNLLATNATYITPVLNANTTYYVQATLTSCTSNTRTPVTINVNQSPAAPSVVGNSIICSGNTSSLTATAPGGTYRWFDASTNGSLLTTDATYTTPVLTATTTYYVEAISAAGCTGTRSPVTVTVTPLANPAFNYSSGTFCVTGTNPTPIITGNASGTFSSSPTGLVFISTSTGQIDLAASALGTYIITFLTNGTCVYSSRASVTITNSPNASFIYSDPYCQKQTNPLPVFANGASAGVFSSVPSGLVFISMSTGEIDLRMSAAGSYTLTNNIAASGGCAAASANNTITITTAATVNPGNNQTVCASLPISLSGTVGGSASNATWSGGSGRFSNTSLLNTVYTPAAGETSVKIYLTTEDPTGPCTAAKDSITLIIIPLPAAPTATGTNICAGNTTALTATAPGGIYQWYDAPVNGTLLATSSIYSTPVLNSTSTYYVQSTLNGCAGPRTLVVANVTPIPPAPSASGTTACSGNTISLTATAPGGSYQWYDAPVNGNLLVTNATYVTPILTNTTSYYVQSTVNGCVSFIRTIVDVTVNQTPVTPVISSNSPICVGSTLTLAASLVTGATYHWSGPNNFGSTLPSPIIANIVSASAGIYSLTITVNGCASNAGIISISPVIAAPVASSNSPVCEGSTLKLTATSITGVTYSWTGPNGFTSSAQNPTSAALSFNAGTYLVIASLAGCPGLSDSTPVIINPIPTNPVLSSNSPVCAGNGISITASTIKGANYQWTGPNGFSSFIQSPLIPNASLPANGTYNVSVTAAGCTATAASSINILVNPIPITPVAGNNGPLCEGGTLTIFSTTIAGASYRWTGPAGFSSAAQNPFISGITVASADTFKVLAIVNGCASNAAVTRPIINKQSTANAGNDQTVCGNKAIVTISGNVTGGSNTGTWSSKGSGTFFPNNTSLNTSYRASNADTAAGNVILTLRSTNNGACIVSASSLSVNITDAPTVSAGNDVFVCSNDSIVILKGIVTIATGGIWTSSGTGQLNPSNTSLSSVYIPSLRDILSGKITLQLTTTGNQGCNAVSNSKIVVITKAPIVNAGPDRLVIENRNIQLDPIVNGVNVQYEWMPNLYLNNNTIKNPIVTGKQDQLYTLTVTGAGGCISSDETFIKVLKPIIIPNVFSPNGDGINDVWIIEQLVNYPGATVEVYTRTGQLIYSTVGYDKPWDGNYNNKPVPVATYYYIINPKLTGTILSGSVTILR